jgi:hypothetical protein
VNPDRADDARLGLQAIDALVHRRPDEREAVDVR